MSLVLVVQLLSFWNQLGMFFTQLHKLSLKSVCPKAPNIFLFEPHYALAGTYAQQAVLHRINVPTIDGFQCPTVEQDAEQNALLKALLFTPWSCTDAHKCGCVTNFNHFLCNAGTAAERAADLRRGAASDAPQPAATTHNAET